jgi:hypothetical protein
VVAIQRLAAADLMDLQWIRARPPADAGNQVALAEVHQAHSTPHNRTHDHPTRVGPKGHAVASSSKTNNRLRKSETAGQHFFLSPV